MRMSTGSTRPSPPSSQSREGTGPRFLTRSFTQYHHRLCDVCLSFYFKTTTMPKGMRLAFRKSVPLWFDTACRTINLPQPAKVFHSFAIGREKCAYKLRFDGSNMEVSLYESTDDDLVYSESSSSSSDTCGSESATSGRAIHPGISGTTSKRLRSSKETSTPGVRLNTCSMLGTDDEQKMIEMSRRAALLVQPLTPSASPSVCSGSKQEASTSVEQCKPREKRRRVRFQLDISSEDEEVFNVRNPKPPMESSPRIVILETDLDESDEM